MKPIVVLIAAVLLLAATPAPAPHGVLIDRTYATSAAPTIDASAANADLSVHASAANRVHVVVRQLSAGTTPPIEIMQRGDRITVKVQSYRGPWWSRLFDHQRQPWMRIEISAPAGSTLSTGFVNGGTTIRGIHGRLTLSSVNGRETAEGTGDSVRASTVNGDVSLTVATSGSTPHISIDTVNGAIALHLPGGWRGRVKTSTVNGHVTNPFPQTQGTPGASLSTVNGDITITR